VEFYFSHCLDHPPTKEGSFFFLPLKERKKECKILKAKKVKGHYNKKLP
jgi:hypothetical protein